MTKNDKLDLILRNQLAIANNQGHFADILQQMTRKDKKPSKKFIDYSINEITDNSRKVTGWMIKAQGGKGE